MFSNVGREPDSLYNESLYNEPGREELIPLFHIPNVKSNCNT